MMFWMAYGTPLKRTGCLEPFDETESLPLTDIPCSGIFQVSVANWFCAYVSLRRASLD